MFTIKHKKSGEVLAKGTPAEGTARLFEGNWYFPRAQVDMSQLVITERTYTCPYKGVCYWIDLKDGDDVIQNVAWTYFDLKHGYEMIQDEIAFYSRETQGTKPE